MADIQQWRRMIQPTRTRTPAVEVEDNDATVSPTTPRKGLKPKFSSYFTQTSNATGQSKADEASAHSFFGLELPSWPADFAYPSPNADNLIDSIMGRLLSQPHESLDSRFNSMLLQVFEAFRHLSDSKRKLQTELEQEVDKRLKLEQAMERYFKQWDQEKQDYKAEVKRLELILASGKRGLAEVTLARQDSLLRSRRARTKDSPDISDDKTLETIFEFLERTKRYEDKAWSSQRGNAQ